MMLLKRLKKMMQDKYNHKEVENGKYHFWLEKEYFKAGNKNKEAFSIMIPPPNITGKLHIGHAIDNTIQDVIARYKRLQGYDVLFLPGMDHAGIATQAKIDEKLKSMGLNRYDIGRDKFLEYANEWKEEYSNHIHKQWEVLGNSLDYSKEAFTLNNDFSKAVIKTFVDYYKQGLIYQGYRIINWDPKAKTALSNIEVVYKEIEGKMYYFKYRFPNSDKYLAVATTRPETMFADVCVVVNPNDERYQDLIGKKVINPANNEEIKIIADDYIDIDFGTGAMKCTPAHDPNDYQIALRHNLEMPICMHPDARMNELAGEFENLDRFEARNKLVLKIMAEGNFIKEEKIIHNVAHSERSDAMIEPYLSKQWFVRMKPLADEVLKQQEGSEKVNFYPQRFNQTLNHWLNNIEDWCISRQLWWGHRIPVYYHKKDNSIYCEYEAPLDLENYIQDEDVLDTWFSSALWPFVTLGWPSESDDYKRYYPNSLLVAGYDIQFFWVARMLFSARYFTKKTPFKDCLLHGLIRDAQGRKMSKSLGNGIDPIDLVNEYGCDALRLYLSSNSTPGLDLNYNPEKLAASWNFINKLWNAARFVISQISPDFKIGELKELSKIDQYILAKFNYCLKQVEMNLDRYELAIAANELIKFIWDEFCSNYIEFSKIALYSEDEQLKNNTLNTLIYMLKSILIMLSPYIPFVCEEIYKELPNSLESINLEAWPKSFNDLNEKDVNEVAIMIDIIKCIRELKTTNKIKPSKVLNIKINSELALSDKIIAIIEKLAKVKFNTYIEEETLIRTVSNASIEFIIDEIIDKQAELEKCESEIKKLEFEIKRCETMLSNEKFITKAPSAKINEEKEKLSDYQKQLAELKEKLNSFK